MASFSDSLDTQHRQLDGLVERVIAEARAKNWGAYRVHFAILVQGLERHMAFEEEALYPVLEKTAATAVRELRAQHERLSHSVETLGAAAPEYDPEGCIGELDRLKALMHAHHQAEMALDPQYASRPIPRLVPGEAPAMDLRGLQPPEPIVRIFEALERGPGAPLRVILPHEPVPLYGLLAERGFHYSGSPRPDGGYELLIERI